MGEGNDRRAQVTGGCTPTPGRLREQILVPQSRSVGRDFEAGAAKLNLTAFIAGELAGAFPEIVGEPYRDGDGLLYTPLIRQPVLIYGADLEALRRARQRAVDRQVRVAVYTEALFQTSNDADNRAAVVRVAGSDLDLVGLGLYAERRLALVRSRCARQPHAPSDADPGGR